MKLTAADVARLGRRRAQRLRESNAHVLTVFVPIMPQNPLNGALGHAHWSKRARWARTRREAAQLAILVAMGHAAPWPARVPKCITFVVYAHNAFDSDNLQAVCKPIRDALKDMRLIDDDRPSAGHTFRYEQEVSRKRGARRGVEVTVAVAPSGADGRPAEPR